MALVSNPHTLERNMFSTPSPLSADVPCSISNRKKRSLEESYDQFVPLDLINDDESEDEGEIMLLAMILLQIHGVKLANVSAQELDQSKKKRQRTSPEQLSILEHIFETDKMPSQQTRIHLAEQLGMSSRRVQIWFQNKRAKVKRGLNKSTEFDDISSPIDDDDLTADKASPSDALASPTATSSDRSSQLSSATLSTLSLLNSSLVPPSSPSLKKTQIIPMKETSGNYADLAKKSQG